MPRYIALALLLAPTHAFLPRDEFALLRDELAKLKIRLVTGDGTAESAFELIDQCNAFLVFGTKNYAADLGA